VPWLVPFLDSLRVELAGRGLGCCELAPAGQAPSPRATVHIQVELVPCAADADRGQARVAEPVRTAAVERQIDLADIAETARPRALALAVAEMVRSLGQAEPTVKPEAPLPVAVRAAPSPLQPRAELSLHLAAEARGYPTRDTLSWGGRAGVAAAWRFLHVGLDVGGGFAGARIDDGSEVRLRMVSAGLGLGPRFATRAAVVELELRGELGRMWVRGQSDVASVRTGAGADLTATAGLRAAVEAPARLGIRPRVALEGGAVLQGVKAEAYGTTVAGVTGYYLLGAFGVAISL
jgi:hypothetical protein